MEARIDLRGLKPAPRQVGDAVGPGRTIEFEWVCEGCASDCVVAEGDMLLIPVPITPAGSWRCPACGRHYDVPVKAALRAKA